jgi:hypothetical protein
MRGLTLIASLVIAVVLGAGQALAFQEMPAPPPEDAAEANAKPKPKPQHDPLRLGTPGTAADVTQAEGGLKLFGYTLMPKLNFGLDVLYGQDQEQLEFQGPSAGTVDEKSDMSVLGKVKRRF